MKTGRDADQPGQYSSECCLAEIRVIRGQMFPHCPRCNSLTVWDLMRPNPESYGRDGSSIDNVLASRDR
jgi:hypothetical protein